MMDVLEIPEIRRSIVPLSIENYQELCKKDPKHYKNTELFRGMVIEKMTKSSEHDFYSQIFYENFKSLLPIGYLLRVEKGIHINESDLEPDISIIKGNPKDFKHRKPTTARLVLEVAVSSLVYDRNKALDYAQANVEEYWIVNAEKEEVEVYTSPSHNGYKEIKKFQKEEIISIFGGEIKLSEIFD